MGRFRSCFLAISLAVTASGQSFVTTPPPEAPRFPSASYFKQRFHTPSTQVELSPVARLEDFVVDGRFELSLRGYLELVMTNHPQIMISKLSVEIPRNAITRSYSRFDPTLAFGFNATRRNNPPTSVLQGAQDVLSNLTQPFTADYQQVFETGTTFTTGFGATKISTNDRFATFNPALNSSVNFGFAQPLLRNRGRYITRIPIMVAQSRLRQSEESLEDEVLRTLSFAELAYWDAIQARESLAVQQENLRLRGEALKRAERELELGALSPLEIYQPQAEYASAEVLVTQGRFLLERRLDTLRRQIGADLDTRFQSLPINLTEPVLPPADTSTLDREALVARAVSRRPDLRAVRVSLDIDDLNIEQAGNALRPDLALTGNYTSAGRGGDFYDRTLTGTGQPVAPVPGGLGDAMRQMFGFNFPTYVFGLRLQLPVRDRRAAADLADALVAKKMDAYRIRNLEQTVRLEVLNAINDVEAGKASVQQAIIARDFAQKRVEAEQKRYELGTTVLFFVLDAQTQLIRAENDVVTQSLAYRRALVNLLRTTGELLEERGIRLQ